MNKNFLRPPDARIRKELAAAVSTIQNVFPLKTAHKKELPFSVQDLSLLLTSERGQIQGYWQKPSLTGAYLYYFLPWNLLRLSWILPGLKIDLAAESRVLDLGSGPLTLPLALWLSRPDLRAHPLSLTCADTAPRPLELGRGIMEALAGQENKWNIHLMRASIEIALRKAGRVHLITAGNVLNELQARQGSLEERLEELFYSMDRSLEPDGQILIVEPGTRLGGKIIAILRQVALEEGYRVEAPCTHEASCPYAPVPEQGKNSGKGGAPRQSSGWCHFSLTAEGAPQELVALSQDAGLEKERLSFACLLLRKPGKIQSSVLPEKTTQGGIITPVRVISDPIRIPQKADSMRYVCSPHGLGLLAKAAPFKSGAMVEAFLPDKAERDAKSGAWMLLPAQPESPRKYSPSPARKPARPATANAGQPARKERPEAARPENKDKTKFEKSGHKHPAGSPDRKKKSRTWSGNKND